MHAKGVVLCERAYFCLLSAFYKTLPSKNPSKNLCLHQNPLQTPSKNPSKKHLLLENLLRTLLRSVRLHDPLGVHPMLAWLGSVSGNLLQEHWHEQCKCCAPNRPHCQLNSIKETQLRYNSMNWSAGRGLFRKGGGFSHWKPREPRKTRDENLKQPLSRYYQFHYFEETARATENPR